VTVDHERTVARPFPEDGSPKGSRARCRSPGGGHSCTGGPPLPERGRGLTDGDGQFPREASVDEEVMQVAWSRDVPAPDRRRWCSAGSSRIQRRASTAQPTPSRRTMIRPASAWPIIAARRSMRRAASSSRFGLVSHRHSHPAISRGSCAGAPVMPVMVVSFRRLAWTGRTTLGVLLPHRRTPGPASLRSSTKSALCRCKRFSAWS